MKVPADGVFEDLYEAIADMFDTSKDRVSILHFSSQRILTKHVGVVVLHCVVLITECHNSHKHSQSPLINLIGVLKGERGKAIATVICIHWSTISF